MEARGFSSAVSSSNATVAHMRSWFHGHTHDWVSAAVWSDGNPYGISEGLFYEFPVMMEKRGWSFVNGLDIKEDQKQKRMATANELLRERKAIENLLRVLKPRSHYSQVAQEASLLY